MSSEQFRREQDYSVVLIIAGILLRQALITKVEYRKLKAAFIARYRPLIGSLPELGTLSPLG